MQTNKISRNAVLGGRVVTAGGGAVAGKYEANFVILFLLILEMI